MKITKKQLRAIIKEECVAMANQEHRNIEDSNDQEVGMAINQLQAISAIAKELSTMVRELNYIPEWGDGKVATVLDRLNSLRSYMVGKSLGREQ